MARSRLNILIKTFIALIVIVGLGLYFNSVLKNWDVEQDLGSNYILVLQDMVLMSVGLLLRQKLDLDFIELFLKTRLPVKYPTIGLLISPYQSIRTPLQVSKIYIIKATLILL